MKILFIAPTGNFKVVDAGYGNASIGILNVLNSMKKDEKYPYIKQIDCVDTTIPMESQKIDYKYDIAILVTHPSSFENVTVTNSFRSILNKAQRKYLSVVREANSVPVVWKWLWNSDLFDGFLAPSRFIGKLLSKETKKPIFYYPHFVDISKFKQVDRGKKLIEDKFTVLFIGQYTKRKGLEDSLVSFVRALGNYNDTRMVIKYHYMSKNEIPIETLIKNIVMSNCIGWNSSIFVLDEKLNDERLSDLYRNSSLFVSIARGEGFGLTNVEAMSVGLPCIYTNWSAMPESAEAPGNIAIDYHLDESVSMVNYGYDIGSKYAIPSIGKTMDALRLKYDLWKTDRRKYYEEVCGNRGIIDNKFGYDAIAKWLDVILQNKKRESLNYDNSK